MAAVVSSYPSNVYHQQSYPNPKLASFYGTPYLSSNIYKLNSQNHSYSQQLPKHTRIATPIVTIEPSESNVQTLRPRREPRVRRQIIVLPTPDPIYRQVRHRLPTPERQVIRRTVIQKANGEVIVQQERHRKKTRHHSPSDSTTQARTSRTQPAQND